MAVQNSMELASSSCDDDGHPSRTGNLWSCVAHIITAVIGSGVLSLAWILSLAWSTAQLGWIAGPIALLCFAIVTYISAFLLSDCYRSPDPVTGTRNYCYMDAVRVNLGKTQTWFCGLLQYLSMYGTCVAYVITTSTTTFKPIIRVLVIVTRYATFSYSIYFVESSACAYGDNFFMLVFGLVQIIVSQIPDIHSIEWLSVVAAIMSFAYSSIGFGLGFAKVLENGRIKGSITGVPTANVADKLWLAFLALGDIAFAYPYSLILLEIQDTLKSPPAENKTMKKGSMVAIFITTFFYLCCGCFGYAAFGDKTPGNSVRIVLIHLVGGYQIYSQPVFSFVEGWFSKKYPRSGFVNKFYTFKLPLFPPLQVNLLRVCFRTAYVASTTAIAMVFPYFNIE
ncbi:probable amino acid permease 7 [Jatropha curcas]|uniref:probable amino acid permease 7 n=1 Tax=Jatropha curcas TaxID=180498 RepID=UPI0018941548|nr:probable amino acid permease 7 [Jatropha curcas]